MLQLKLFRSQEDTRSDLIDGQVYRFENPRVFGFRFRPSPHDLRDVSLKASQMALRPVLLGAETFLRLIEVASHMGWTLRDVVFKPNLNEDDAESLLEHIYRVRNGEGMALFQAFVLRLLQSVRGAIDYVAFNVPVESRSVKVTVYSSGILYINADEPALPTIDTVVSEVARFTPGYNNA